MKRLLYADATRHALAQEMAADERVWVLGQDVRSGHFSTSSRQYAGLVETFGPERVLDAPLSEEAIVGAGVGAALVGARSLIELRNVDFAVCALSGIVNEAAKLPAMSGGQLRVPVVFRMGVGPKPGRAAQHTQSLEAWFVHTPGLSVVAPSTPANGAGLLRSSLRSDGPVVFLEHKAIWSEEGDVEEELPPVPLGRARVVKPGGALTLVTWGRTVRESLEAAADFEDAVEIIDLMTLWPWDHRLVFDSVERTGRLMVAHEAVAVGGLGGELIGAVCRARFSALVAPPVLVGAPRSPMPFAKPLEDACLVRAPTIRAAISKLIDRS